MVVCCSWFAIIWIRFTWAFLQVTELVNELTPGQSDSTVSCVTPHHAVAQDKPSMCRIQLQHQ